MNMVLLLGTAGCMVWLFATQLSRRWLHMFHVCNFVNSTISLGREFTAAGG
jgi:hypothetical protein